MIIETGLQKIIDDSLIADNAAREASHEPSGMLSASMLYQPLRFQIMKNIGVPRKTMEPYVLGKFNRGNDVEEWLMNQLDKAGALIDKQVKVEYRGVVGIIDAMVDSDKFYFKKGIMPHECKSVTNAKLKRVQSTGEVDYHYKLQGCFYGLAKGTEFYAIDIVSAEDLRVYTYIFPVIELKKDIEEIINKYNGAMAVWKAEKKLPPLEINPKVTWAANPMYAPFEEKWIMMSDETLIKELEALK